MAESSAAEGVPVLRTVILTLSVPETVLARFRAEFPALRFVVLGEETAGDEGFAYAPASSDPDVLRDADGLIGWSLDAETLADAPRLRWMHAASAGVERYDFATLAERGIMLTNSRGVCAPNMAEHVLGMMLALARRIPRLVQAQTQRA